MRISHGGETLNFVFLGYSLKRQRGARRSADEDGPSADVATARFALGGFIFPLLGQPPVTIRTYKPQCFIGAVFRRDTARPAMAGLFFWLHHRLMPATILASAADDSPAFALALLEAA